MSPPLDPMPEISAAPLRRYGSAVAEDGATLTYSTNPAHRSKAPALICANGAGVATFFWDPLAEHFGERGHTVVLWDYRGHGGSGPPADIAALDITACARDLLRIMDASSIPRAVLLGHSLGVQVILECWRLAPDRVCGLVPILGSSGRVADSFLDSRAGRHVIGLGAAVARRAPRLMRLGFRVSARGTTVHRLARWVGMVHPDLAPEADLARYFSHLAELEPRLFFQMVEAASKYDARPWLGAVDVPTLVIAGERDRFTPLRRSEEMVELIPNAELLRIPEGSHVALVEQPERVNRHLEAFLDGPVAAYLAEE